MAIENEWWRNKLAEDMYATLKLKEQTLPTFYNHGQSPQLWIRRHLVDWLSVIVAELEICATSQHLAIYLLDYFMDGLQVEQCYLHLVALTCLLLAIKFEDHCDRIPHYMKLNSYVPTTNYNSGQSYTAKQFLNMELNILKFTSFELCIPTVAHFLPYFLQVGVDEDDLRDGLPITSKSVVKTYLEKHAKYFQEICLQDHTFREFSPSLIAASCIAGARICLHLTPTWPKQLELMTDYYLEQLLPCLHSMLGIHHQDSLNTLMSNYATPEYQAMNYIPSTAAQHNYFPSPTMKRSYVPSVGNNSNDYPLSTVNRSYVPQLAANQAYVNSVSNQNSYVPVTDVYGSCPTYQQSINSSNKHAAYREETTAYSSVISYSTPDVLIGVGSQLFPRVRES